MSLCQSLRQYVFVHAAVIEGALIIVDEERERLRNEGKELPAKSGEKMQGGDKDAISAAPAHSHSSSGSSIGKRGASPTELLKKDKKGEVSLMKRPSIKRQQSRRETIQMPPFGTG